MELEGRRGSCDATTAYPAELYIALHRGTPGDIEFYLRACAGAERVLELGCGYGRVLEALARAGHRVVGLDRDAELGEVARRAVSPLGGRVVLAEMTSFDLGERFDRVIIPFNGLYCLLDRDAVLRCFERIRLHLAPGGMLIFDVWSADHFHTEADPSDLPDDHLEPVGPVEAYGRTYDVFEQSVWSRDAQRILARYTYVARDGSAEVTCNLAQRYLRSREVVELLEAAGLEPLVLHGGFDQHSYDAESELLIVTAATSERSCP